MTPENVSKFIKNLRNKNNLTQKKLSEELGVTYQAVSKWENGKNIPDIEILKLICDKYNVNIEDIIGTKKKKNNNKKIIVIIIIFILIISILTIVIIKQNSSSFYFKQVSTTCNDFKITGSMAYNKKTSSIYISNVEFCGSDDEIYKRLECNFYEDNNNTKTKISSCPISSNLNIKDYLNSIEIKVNDYSFICKDNIENNNLYIELQAINKDNKTIIYKIPIKLNDNCK